MPKKRESVESSGSKGSKKRRMTNNSGSAFNCDVKSVMGCRIAPNTLIDMEFYASWVDFDDSHNSWEPYENLRMNLELSNFISDTLAERELEIYITVANIKERIKKRIRKSLRNKKKMEIMFEVQPFDPKEYRTTLVFYHLIKDPPQEFKDHLDDFVYRSYFFEMEKMQRIKHDQMVEAIKKIDDIQLTIENDEDFEILPEFNYITKNFLADEVNTTMLESPNKSSTAPPKGCSCETCDRKSECCPKLAGEPFAYTKQRKLKFKQMEKIFECGDFCKCGADCVNRVSQRNPNVSLCVFKTLNGRGWGVKTLKKIKEGTLIMEYRGELLGHHEAGKRKETQYLFDLNMDREPHGFYTLDANLHGSIAKFTNHSCGPNSKMWFINDCGRDPKSQKLCIFAARDIESDEEITIDYCPRDQVPFGSLNSFSMSQSHVTECLCETEMCRGNIF